MVKQTNDHDLVPSLRNSLLSTMSDPLMDVGEVLFDSVLEDGLLKDIPIIGTISGLAKAGNKLRERNLAMNTLKFIQGFRCQNVSEDEIRKYRERMDNPKIAEKELGYVLIILDKEIQLEKAKLLGKAYGAFVQGQIQWDKFIEIRTVKFDARICRIEGEGRIPSPPFSPFLCRAEKRGFLFGDIFSVGNSERIVV